MGYKIKFRELRDWERNLVLRCHIAGKLTYEQDKNGSDAVDDGSICWTCNHWVERFPATLGFPELWFKIDRRRPANRTLSKHALQELNGHEEELVLFAKRREIDLSKIKELHGRMYAALRHSKGVFIAQKNEFQRMGKRLKELEQILKAQHPEIPQ